MKRFGKTTGIVSRACSGCGGDLGDRYLKQRYCKACHAASMRKNRPKHKDLPELARKKANCRAHTHQLIKRGVIGQLPCKVCGSLESQVHHPDYNDPYLVVWLCRDHHLELHKC